MRCSKVSQDIPRIIEENANPYSSECYVYIFATQYNRGTMTWPIKVGIAKDCRKRFLSLQQTNMVEMDFFFAFKCHTRDMALAVEKVFHRRNKIWRIKGEWYFCEPDFAGREIVKIFREILLQIQSHENEADDLIQDSGVLTFERRFKLSPKLPLSTLQNTTKQDSILS